MRARQATRERWLGCRAGGLFAGDWRGSGADCIGLVELQCYPEACVGYPRRELSRVRARRRDPPRGRMDAPQPATGADRRDLVLGPKS